MKLDREFYTYNLVSEGYVKKEGEGYEVYTFVNEEENVYRAKLFGGKRAKPDGFYRYGTLESLNDGVEKFIKNITDRIEWKKEEVAKRKEKVKKMAAEVKVGDIYVNSWGYDETHVDFYKVLSVKGSFAEIVAIGSKTSDDYNGFYHSSSAAPDLVTGEPMRKKIGEYGFKINSYSTANKWDGTGMHETGPYGGR